MKRFRDSNYYVTECGRVTATKATAYLKSQFGRGGYLHVLLYLNLKPTLFSIHRLVAEVFLENPNNYPCVNHKDGDKLNNRVENLEWCTRSQNTQHAIDTGLLKVSRGERQHKSKLTEEQVLEIRRERRETKISQTELAKKYNVLQSTISDIIRRVSWTHI